MICELKIWQTVSSSSEPINRPAHLDVKLNETVLLPLGLVDLITITGTLVSSLPTLG